METAAGTDGDTRRVFEYRVKIGNLFWRTYEKKRDTQRRVQADADVYRV